MALTSCYLQKDPTTEAILYLYFESCFFNLLQRDKINNRITRDRKESLRIPGSHQVIQ
jgi:hypothetical protein